MHSPTDIYEGEHTPPRCAYLSHTLCKRVPNSLLGERGLYPTMRSYSALLRFIYGISAFGRVALRRGCATPYCPTLTLWDHRWSRRLPHETTSASSPGRRFR